MRTLREMRGLDINAIDRETVVNANTVAIDMDLPKPQRMAELVKQMNGNPYFFISGTILVKVSFTDTEVTFDERVESHLRTI